MTIVSYITIIGATMMSGQHIKTLFLFTVSALSRKRHFFTLFITTLLLTWALPSNAYALDTDKDGIPDSEESYCDQPTVANINFGTGVYRDQLYIFNWTDTSFADGFDEGDSQTFDLSNGLHIVATVTRVVSKGGDPSRYRPRDLNTWDGSGLYRLYDTPKRKEVFYPETSNDQNEDIEVTFQFKATLNGKPFPLDLLALDGEATHSSNERLTFTTDGSPWQLLEKSGNGGTFSGAGTDTLVDDFTNKENFSIYYSRNAETIGVVIDAGGREGIGFGIRLVCDFDGDGIPNRMDIDSDNDGIPDLEESGQDPSLVDTDHDGVLDDAAVGTTVTPVDTDHDGHPDYLDIDADNDGIVDNIEAQTTSDYTAPSGTDTDGDGLDDAYDPDNGGTAVIPTDTDRDGTPDYLDTDSDGDGISDNTEGWGTDNGRAAVTPPSDADTDGLDDAYDNNKTHINPTNGQTPDSFPDDDRPGGDRDWRQTPNQTPDASDNRVTTSQDTPVRGNVIADNDGDGADSDPDGDNLTVTQVVINGTTYPVPANGRAAISLAQGNLTLRSDGSYTFAPAAGYHGTVPAAAYTVSDGNGGTDTARLFITVNPAATPDPVNGDPDAGNDNYTMPENGTPITLALLTNDKDPDGDPLTVTSINGTPLTPGTARTITVPHGTVDVDTAGNITFAPDPDYNGSVIFSYEIGDGNGGTDSADVRITVTPANDAPATTGTTTPTGDNTRKYQIGDFFWIDSNNNGVYDSDEKAVSNASIDLLDSEGNLVDTTTTDAAGRYHFDVLPGDYTVRFHMPQDKMDNAYVFSRDSATQEHKDMNAKVGNGASTGKLVLNAAIACPCSSVEGDSVGMSDLFSLLPMFAVMVLLGGYFVRREEQTAEPASF